MKVHIFCTVTLVAPAVVHTATNQISLPQRMNEFALYSEVVEVLRLWEREREINIFFKGSMLNTYQHTKYMFFSLRSSFKRFKYVKGNIVQRWICFRVYTYLDDLLLEWHLINLFIDLIVLCYKFWVSALLMMDTNWVLYQLTKPWPSVFVN